MATLLEGSVRRIGNRVRVNVQLVDAENDQHLWAEDYDRDLTDVFAIQTDLAQKIADGAAGETFVKRKSATRSPADTESGSVSALRASARLREPVRPF